MPITISDLRADLRELSIAIEGVGMLNVTYRPSAITAEVEAALMDSLERQRPGQAVVSLLAETLVDWDLQNDDGKPLPADAATLRRLPLRFLMLIAEAITRDIAPNPMSAGTSGAGLQRAERSGRVQHGTR